MKRFLTYLLAAITGIFISFFLLLSLLVIIVSASSGDKPVEISPNTLLHIKLDEQIVERAVDNPIDYLPGNFATLRQIGLNDILGNIRKAKTDENIAGIYLDLLVIPGGISSIEEIRNAILDFRESGKFVLAYSDLYTQKAYYLASAADRVYLNPAGEVLFTGLSSNRTFYKGIMEKLDIQVEVIRHGDYKSAVEPFMNESMSDENREQTLIWLRSIWNQMLKEISESRNIEPRVLNDLAEHLKVKSASHALEYELVDGLKYKDEIIDELKNLTGTGEKDDLSSITLRKYTRVLVRKDFKGFSKDRIAVVYAHGDVLMGSAGEGTIASDRISKAIREARRDSSIKAIVFRVNSGGGSALASEVIWRELDLARKVKPVVASFGDLAASGGYYISVPADTIMAMPATITGSIGVFAILPDFGRFLDRKIGLSFDAAKTNPSADFGSFLRPVNQSERAFIEHAVNKTYDDFVTRVADGRGMNRDQVDVVAQGKVWSGVIALENGLIDLYGGLFDAIEMSAGMAGLEKYRVKSLPVLEDPFELFLKKLAENAQLKIRSRYEGTYYKYIRQLDQLDDYTGIQARLPFLIDIN